VLSHTTLKGKDVWATLAVPVAKDVRDKFVQQLLDWTGGVPKFVCLALTSLLQRMRSEPDWTLGSVKGVKKVFEDVVRPDMLQAPFMRAFLDTALPTRDDLSKPGARKDFMDLIGVTGPSKPEERQTLDPAKPHLLTNVARFGLCLDRVDDDDCGADTYCVAFPRVLRAGLTEARVLPVESPGAGVVGAEGGGEAAADAASGSSGAASSAPQDLLSDAASRGSAGAVDGGRADPITVVGLDGAGLGATGSVGGGSGGAGTAD
jgi:hypothetical protein